MKIDAFFNFSLAVVISFVLLSWVGGLPGISQILTDYASAATSAAVTVTASVSTAISCATDQTTTSFGTLTSSAVSTSTSNASTTMSCVNAAAGCTLSLQDAGGTGTNSNPGLWNSTSSALIESPNAAFSASATLAAGTEGYGIQATTTTAGNGATLGIVLRYRQDLLGLNGVGGFSTTSITVASTTASSSAREIVVTHKAAISTETPGGTYADTITYSCVSN